MGDTWADVIAQHKALAGTAQSTPPQGASASTGGGDWFSQFQEVKPSKSTQNVSIKTLTYVRFKCILIAWISNKWLY